MLIPDPSQGVKSTRLSERRERARTWLRTAPDCNSFTSSFKAHIDRDRRTFDPNFASRANSTRPLFQVFWNDPVEREVVVSFDRQFESFPCFVSFPDRIANSVESVRLRKSTGHLVNNAVDILPGLR